MHEFLTCDYVGGVGHVTAAPLPLRHTPLANNNSNILAASPANVVLMVYNNNVSGTMHAAGPLWSCAAA